MAHRLSFAIPTIVSPKRRPLRIALITFICLSITLLGFSQEGIVRAKKFSTGSIENRIVDVSRTSGGYYCKLYNGPGVGNSYTFIKVDTAFNEISHTSAGNGQSVLLADGGTVSVQMLRDASHSWSDDYCVARFNQYGVRIWSRYFGGTGTEIPATLMALSNGNILVTGTATSTDGDVVGKTNNDAQNWIIEVSPDGNIVRQKLLDANVGLSLFPSQDGFYMAGQSALDTGYMSGNHGKSDILILKLDQNWNITKTFCLGGSEDEGIRSLLELPGGELMITGFTTSTDGMFASSGRYYDGFVAKLSSTGNLVWKSIVSGIFYEDVLRTVILANGDIAAAGYTTSHIIDEFSFPANHTYENAIIFVMDPNGNKKWTKVIGSNCADFGYGLTEAYNGNLIIGGLAYYCSTDGDFQGVPSVPGESVGFLMEVRNSFNVLKGSVFFDENANGVKDSGEAFMVNGAYKALASKEAYQTRQILTSGNYMASVDTGRYTTLIEGAYVQDLPNYRITPKYKVTEFANLGQTQTIDFRFVPTSLVNQDLTVSIQQNSSGYLSNTNRFKVIVANNGGMTVNNAVINLKTGNYFNSVSSTKAISSHQGDTIRWIYASLPAGFKDTIDVIGISNGTPVLQPGQRVNLEAIAEPYQADFDSVDNKFSLITVLKGQNEAVSGLGLTVSALDSIVINRSARYNINYQFTHVLDSLKGMVVFKKSPYAQLEKAIPTPSLIKGDSIVWNFKDLSYLNTDTIQLTLRYIDSTGIAVGSNINQNVTLKLLTADTATITISQALTQKVTKKLAPLDMINTELPPPNGLRWVRSFGGSELDQFRDILKQADGVLVVGTTSSTDGDINLPGDGFLRGLIAKLDNDGRIIWKKILATSGQSRILTKVRKTKDNNYLAVGTSYSDDNGIHGGEEGWMIKFNEAGDVIWSRTYGSPGYDYFFDFAELSDRSIIITGSTNSNGGDVSGYVNPNMSSEENAWVVHFDSVGNIIRQKCVNLPTAAVGASAIAVLDGSRFIIGGRTATDTSSKGYLAKMDTTGNVIWLKEYNVSGNSTDLKGFIILADSSLVAIGSSGNTAKSDPANVGVHGSLDAWVANISKDGNLLQQKYLGGSQWDAATFIATLSNDHYLVGGVSHSDDGNLTRHFGSSDYSDGWLFEMDVTGKIIWQKNIGGSDIDVLSSAVELTDGSIIGIGNSFTMSDGDIHGGHGQADALVFRIAKSNFIKGEVYIDKNNNAVHDAEEPVFSAGRVIFGKKGEERIALPVNGQYSIPTDTGKYYLRFEGSDTLYFNVYPEQDSVSFITFPEVKKISFRLQKKSNISDLAIELLPISIPRPGFEADYLLKYSNQGTTDIDNIVVKMTMSDKQTHVNSSPGFYQQKGDTLIWNIGRLESMTAGSIAVTLKLNSPPSVNIGDWLYMTAVIEPVAGDTLQNNNIVQSAQLIRGSFDPNDKSEIHGGKITPAMIDGDEYLTYLVRFQNTGTDTAFKVIVRDTLDSKLDWNSIQMIGASHLYSMKVTGGNAFEWIFDNINLPDSNVNEKLSHGFLSFKVKLKKEVKLLDTVINHASIFFDFNLPIKTNEVSTVVDPELSAGCPGATLYLPAQFKGSAFQWQLNTGSGYADLGENSTYQGTQTAILRINNLQSSWSGYRVRCRIVYNGQIIYGPEYTLKTQVHWKGTAGKAWESPLNWSCGILPDMNTDVIIESNCINYPEVNSDIKVRSILAKPGSSVTVKSGYRIELTGKGKN